MQGAARVQAAAPPVPPVATFPVSDNLYETQPTVTIGGQTVGWGVKWEEEGRPQTILPHMPPDYVWH